MANKNNDIFWFKKTGAYILNGQENWQTFREGLMTFPFEQYKPEPVCTLYDYLKALDK